MAAYELAPQGWFNHSFHISQNGGVVATICGSIWSERAALWAPGCECEAYSTGILRNTFVLVSDGKQLAQAVRAGCFSRTFTVQHEKTTYDLQPEHWWNGAFLVLEAGREIGVVKPQGAFSRKSSVCFPDDWPMHLQLFVIWLVTMQWRSDAATAVVG